MIGSNVNNFISGGYFLALLHGRLHCDPTSTLLVYNYMNPEANLALRQLLSNLSARKYTCRNLTRQ